MIRAGIIGSGIGLKHFEAINRYKGSKGDMYFRKK